MNLTPRIANRFGKAERVRKHREYGKIQSKGRRYQGQFMSVAVLRNTLEHARMGMAVSKKVGNAVVRSRVKRRLRELWRTSPSAFRKLSFDVVFLAKQAIAGAVYREMLEDWLKIRVKIEADYATSDLRRNSNRTSRESNGQP